MNRVSALIICALVGCGESGVSPDALLGDPGGRLALGTTTADGQGFLPFQADQVLIAGAQGGFHVWLKLRIAGLPAGDLKLRRAARRAGDGRVLVETQSVVQVGVATGGYWEQPSPVPLFICPTPAGITVVDQAVEADVAVLGANGSTEGSASATFTVHCPDDARATCLQLCSG
jgi:hypothetical protein